MTHMTVNHMIVTHERVTHLTVTRTTTLDHLGPPGAEVIDV